MKRTQNQFAVFLAKCMILCILMVIIEGKTFNLSGSTSYGIRGGDYRFTCQISGGNFIRSDLIRFNRDSNPVCEQTFTCNPSPSTDPTRLTCGCINGNNRQLYLNITNVQSTDAGTWTCRDAFDIATSSPVILPVYYGPENIRFTPSSIAVIENESRTVNCSADCNPPCTISWYNGGDTSGTIISSSNGLLQLNNIQRQDTAYTCQAEYTILTTTPLTKTLQITVYYGPENIRFTPTGSSITVIENESRTVTCSADCNPPCNIYWYKGSARSGSNGLLSMNNITRQQAGNYTCQVTNTQIPDSLQSKQLMVIVHYPPNITSLTSNATNNMIDEYSTVTFTCSVDSVPSSIISWSRSQGEQLYSGSQYTIPKASCQHTDNYTCTASNNIGQPVSQTIPLYVRCSPRENMVTKRNITNRINTTINLEVDIIAYPPPTFTWYHTPTRQIINTATTQQVSTINYKSTLKITLNSTLFGDYIVSVVNDVGVQNFTITVIDGEPPEPPDKLGNNNMLTIVGGIIGILVIAGVITVIGVVIYRRMAREDSPEDNVPLSNKAKTRPNEMVIDDNLTYEGSDHLFGPQTGAGPGKGQTDNNPMSSKTGQNNQMIIDDNLLYEGSDDLFGPQNGTESEKSKKPAKKPDPEAIYTAVVKKKNGQDNNTASGEVIKKKNGQDNNTASGETGTYENVDLKANPIPTKKLTFNKEGLNYADVVFTNKTPAAKDVKPVYHDAVEYAGIQYGVRGPTPPPVSDSSDDDDTPPPAPTSKQKTKPVKTKKK